MNKSKFDKWKILFLSSNPRNTTSLRLGEEIREIHDGLERSLYRKQFELVTRWEVGSDDMRRALLDTKPEIVHFSGHGQGEEGLIFADDSDQARPINGDALANLFKLCSKSIICVVLNGCYSEIQARKIANYIPYVIGMKKAIGDQSAIEFSTGFYDALGAGEDIEHAYEHGCNAIHMEGSSDDHLAPILIEGQKKAEKTKNLNYPNGLKSFIEDLTQKFVGRKFVFDAIKDFLHSKPKGYFIIEGDPGEGKSTILAKYIQDNPCLAYFNQRLENRNKTSSFLKEICDQIIKHYKLEFPFPLHDLEKDSHVLSILFQHVSSHLRSGEKLIIVIDALDEVDLTSQDESANVLYLPSSLPDNIYLILTKRYTVPSEKHLIFKANTPVIRFKLEDYETQCGQDIEQYILFSLEQDISCRDALHQWIEKRDLGRDEFVKKLAAKSENNFMYLCYVLPEIVSGFYQDLEINKLPQGLENYYKDHWRLMGMPDGLTFPVSREIQIKVNILYTLAALKDPYSAQLISKVASSGKESQLHASTGDVNALLAEWEQFLHRKEIANQLPCYQIYHKSFQDFLYRDEIVQQASIDLKKFASEVNRYSIDLCRNARKSLLTRIVERIYRPFNIFSP